MMASKTAATRALKPYLHQTTTCTATSAAQAIIRPLLTASNPHEDLVRLMSFVIDALLDLPPEHTQPIISLTQAVQDLPLPDFTALEDSKRPFEALWKEAPGFAHFGSDSYMSGYWKKIGKDADGQKRNALRKDHLRKAEIETRRR